MALFTDTVTFYHKTVVNSVDTWTRTVIKDVQWTEKTEKKNENGKISIAAYITVTFPKGKYTGLTFSASNEEDAIVYGDVSDVVNTTAGSTLKDLLKKYEKSGRIKSVNDNSNRDFLQNIKVVLA